MINFRYHVVSLTAVFLALAIGLVVGTAALNGPAVDSLADRVTAMSKSNDQLRETVNNLEAEAKREEDFAAEAAPRLLADTLTNHRVLMLVLPSGRDQADGVAEMLRTTGATITGRIDVQDKFVSPENNDNLLELAVRAAQPSVPTSGLPGNSDGVETSSALLASALVDRPAVAPVTDQDRTAVLRAYGSDGYLTVADNKISGPAEAVVVVSGQPYVDRNSSEKDESVVKLVVQFDKNAAVVVAGIGSTGGNLVAQVRADPTLAQTISTVDNSNTTMGQLVTAMATVEQVTLKKAGPYGVGAGASLMPKRPE
ncbi:copper transporter [Micromonospora sp. NPDC049559]|uniref:copper transporter n=1 Tax=Micromonospora sp. NPDC049559 TaxID=3155923 RepID=UPI003439B96C